MKRGGIFRPFVSHNITFQEDARRHRHQGHVVDVGTFHQIAL